MRMKVTLGTREGWEIPCERWSWRFDPEKGDGSFEVVRSGEMLVPSKYVPEDEWFEITGSRG